MAIQVAAATSKSKKSIEKIPRKKIFEAFFSFFCLKCSAVVVAAAVVVVVVVAAAVTAA